jgi:phosphatidate cytidylyltransferase
MASSQPAKRFDWNNLRIRVLSGVVLAPLALGAVWMGGAAFLVLMSVGVALLTLEWGAMCDRETPIRAALVIAVAILASIFSAYLRHPWIGWLLVALGAGAGAVFTLLRGRIDRPADIAFGVLYVGAPAVALIWLRGAPGGLKWTIMLLAVVWAADICAFLVGNALKGPKLWPRISPNKTWTGFFGGLLGGGAAGLLVAAAPFSQGGPSAASAVWIGLLAAVAAMAGDLWESMLKRRFGVKDSGDLIPGHGGLLDRVDGLMFAAVLVAGVRLLFFQGLIA